MRAMREELPVSDNGDIRIDSITWTDNETEEQYIGFPIYDDEEVDDPAYD